VCVERGGPTPSHPEPGRETPQRRSYWRLTAGNLGPCTRSFLPARRRLLVAEREFFVKISEHNNGRNWFQTYP